MTRTSASSASEYAPALTIPVEKVCWVIIKAREFDVKEAPSDPDSGSNPSDDGMIDVLEEHEDDPVEEELRSFISALSEDEQVDLVALAWLGRDDNALTDWPSIRAEAARAHESHARHTARYLLGEPMLGDFLEEGLAMMGKSCAEFEMNRL